MYLQCMLTRDEFIQLLVVKDISAGYKTSSLVEYDSVHL